MPESPRLSRGGLLAESYGERPYTVTLREEKRPGTNVVLDFAAADGGRPKPSLRYPVRRQDRRGRWKWDEAALERARAEAKDRSAQLRLDRARQDVQPQTLTVEQAWALFHDEERGRLPKSRCARLNSLRAARVWKEWLTPDLPWNRIQPKDVEALARRYRDRGQVPSGDYYLKRLRACYNWLNTMTDLEGLRNPLKGFDIQAYAKDHEPGRPRYKPDEAKALVAVRHEVDPRFALLIALMDDSGFRHTAIRTTMRSDVDCRLDTPPSAADAPYGWIVFPALKHQDRAPHFLTAFERRELDLALSTHLAQLEERYQRRGTDYPLFPGVRLRDMREPVIRPDQRGAHRPMSDSLGLLLLKEAEIKAGVPHVHGRAFHGIRRGWSDYMLQETDLKTLTVAGAWSSQRTPEQIYVQKERHKERARAREAMEKKRGGA